MEMKKKEAMMGLKKKEDEAFVLCVSPVTHESEH